MDGCGSRWWRRVRELHRTLLLMLLLLLLLKHLLLLMLLLELLLVLQRLRRWRHESVVWLHLPRIEGVGLHSLLHLHLHLHGRLHGRVTRHHAFEWRHAAVR
jgi:hypothetical protein